MPVTVIIGVSMMQSVAELDLGDFAKAVPAVITMLAMPLTFSFAESIAIGFVVQVFFMLGIGRGKEVKPIPWVPGLLLLAHLIWRPNRMKFPCGRATGTPV